MDETNPELAATLAKLEAGFEINPPPIAPEDNFVPGLALGIQSTIGTAWWLASFLLYVKNASTDADLTALNGGTILPIGWFWERIAEANGLYNYFALGLLFNFLFYLAGSVVEFIAWIFYLNNTNVYFAAWWFSTIGYWSTILGMALPWILMAVYIEDTMDGNITSFPGNWAVLILVLDLLMWIVFSVLHIIYVPDFLLHIAALPKPPCLCSLPQVDPAGEDASEAIKAAVKEAEKTREYLCAIECPAKKGDCPLAKEEGQSDEDYKAACAALKD